jgi:hypothetical protein
MPNFGSLNNCMALENSPIESRSLTTAEPTDLRVDHYLNLLDIIGSVIIAWKLADIPCGQQQVRLAAGLDRKGREGVAESL